jgi:hypothetical protein
MLYTALSRLTTWEHMFSLVFVLVTCGSLIIVSLWAREKERPGESFARLNQLDDKTQQCPTKENVLLHSR